MFIEGKGLVKKYGGRICIRSYDVPPKACSRFNKNGFERKGKSRP